MAPVTPRPKAVVPRPPRYVPVHQPPLVVNASSFSSPSIDHSMPPHAAIPVHSTSPPVAWTLIKCLVVLHVLPLAYWLYVVIRNTWRDGRDK
ncbi:hypothetical protein HKX48_002832, partial [Thoreauomyces humboldtii]